MCGIFLLLNNSNYDEDFISEQSFKASHRGPEFSSFDFLNNNTKNDYIGFHRLAINGLDSVSNQPINIDDYTLICNGEIYNYKELYKKLNMTPTTNSDCEVIIHCYKKYGIEYTLQLLDGVFAFVLLDNSNDTIFVARDPYGVRPMYTFTSSKNMWIFSSELKQVDKFFLNDTDIITQFPPSNCYILSKNKGEWHFKKSFQYITNLIQSFEFTSYDDIYYNINNYLTSAVVKRIHTSDRPIACLLSGGLDSSLITSIVSKNYNKKLKTFSIGLKGSEDLKYAKIVADFLNTDHTEIVVSDEDFFNAIPEVIEKIESYDTTTVRASVGNYLLGKYIAENTDCKVIFNGDGSDELCGGYLYFHNCPDELEFDKECKRLLNDISYFDVLRSDRSISTNGLEPRTPFLDRKWVQYYLSIDPGIRFHPKHKQCEKYLLRKSFDDGTYLPKTVLWRTKEAFSDGVSSITKPWYEIINDNVSKKFNDIEDNNLVVNNPITNEQKYYRLLFNKYYKNSQNTIPYFWMPKYSNATDSSARTLNIYKQIHDTIESKNNIVINKNL